MSQSSSEQSKDGSSPTQPGSASLAFRTMCLVLAAGGIASRALPLLGGQQRLLRQFPTEDGYLMLTIARNLALGRGMSVSDGTIPTNGTQPLFNFIEALGFFCFGGDKVAGVAWALVVQLLLGVLTAYGLFLLTRRTLSRRPELADKAAYAAAAAWLGSPVVLPHSMNCLETVLYACTLVFALLAWQSLWLARETQKTAALQALLVGLALGVAIWARIDACFLILAVALVHAWSGLGSRERAVKMLSEAVIFGAASVLVISPWLVNNKLRFGSIMPISGTAQAASRVGEHLAQVPSQLAEYATLFLAIPHSVERQPVVLVAETAFVVLVLGVVVALVRRAEPQERALAAAWGVIGLCLCGYYGLFSGAGHFIGRYLFPMSLPGAMLVGLSLCWLDRFAHRFKVLSGVFVVGVLALAAGLHLKIARTKHLHFQVVEYVTAHVPESVWVGAVQSGTLGFFHDRTINLDGKVNPQALQALRERRSQEYVVDAQFGQPPAHIEWLADWQGIVGWSKLAPMDRHFDVVVDDAQVDLGVLRRHP